MEKPTTPPTGEGNNGENPTTPPTGEGNNGENPTTPPTGEGNNGKIQRHHQQVKVIIQDLDKLQRIIKT